MRTEPEPHEVRRLVVWTFRELGTPPHRLFDLEEEIVMRKGRYAARSYRTDDLMAMWLVEVGLLQFYDADGRMLRTINLFARVEPLAAAA
jgi:hypothetical protein